MQIYTINSEVPNKRSPSNKKAVDVRAVLMSILTQLLH